MLIILFYKFVNFFLFFKTWVKWAGSGMESGRSDQSPDPLEGKDHQRLEKVTMIWMSVIFKFLECHWVTCQWPTWTPIWWPTLTATMWQILVTYLDSHLVTRLWWLIPWLPQDFSATRSSAFTTGASSCLSSLPSMPIPNWRSPNTKYWRLPNNKPRVIENYQYWRSPAQDETVDEQQQGSGQEGQVWGVVQRDNDDGLSTCWRMPLWRCYNFFASHNNLSRKNLPPGWKLSQISDSSLNLYHDTMIYNIYLRDHDIMIYISHNNLSQKNLPPWWNNGSRQTNY